MFSGLRSRWRMPARWADSTAPAIRPPKSRTSADVEAAPGSRQLVGQRAAVEELHDDEQAPVVGGAGLVDGHDVRVSGQGADGGALPLEPIGRTAASALPDSTLMATSRSNVGCQAR